MGNLKIGWLATGVLAVAIVVAAVKPSELADIAPFVCYTLAHLQMLQACN